MLIKCKSKVRRQILQETILREPTQTQTRVVRNDRLTRLKLQIQTDVRAGLNEAKLKEIHSEVTEKITTNQVRAVQTVEFNSMYMWVLSTANRSSRNSRKEMTQFTKKNSLLMKLTRVANWILTLIEVLLASIPLLIIPL